MPILKYILKLLLIIIGLGLFALILWYSYQTRNFKGVYYVYLVICIKIFQIGYEIKID